MLTTIVVSPRERFTSLPVSLRSLFSTIAPEVPVVVVEGATPEPLREELRVLGRERPFQLISLPYMVRPNEARNIGLAEARTEYVVLTDNDIHYEPGWLDALEAHVALHGSDAVAPLICIGPPAASMIHHAGGQLHASVVNGRVNLRERHRLMNRPMDAMAVGNLTLLTHVCEFHCMMVRRSFAAGMGGLDERLVTREQMDFAMRALVLGGKVTFARDAIVTYMAKDDFIPIDLEYHLFRWSDLFVVESLDAFEASWGVALDRERVRFAWTAGHRSKAAGTVYPWKRRFHGEQRFRDSVVAPMEAAIMERQLALRAGLTQSAPRALPAERVAQAIADLMAASVTAGAAAG